MARSMMVLLVWACCAAAFGCGSGYNLAPVAGKVTCKGEPIPDATVIFNPLPKSADDANPGKAAQARTDAAGEYQVSTYANGDGAVIGKHTVTVSYASAYEKHPCRVGSTTYEVAPGTNRFDIELAALPKK